MALLYSEIEYDTVTTPAAEPARPEKPASTFRIDPVTREGFFDVVAGLYTEFVTVALLAPVVYPGELSPEEILHAAIEGQIVVPNTPAAPGPASISVGILPPSTEYRKICFAARAV